MAKILLGITLIQHNFCLIRVRTEMTLLTIQWQQSNLIENSTYNNNVKKIRLCHTLCKTLPLMYEFSSYIFKTLDLKSYDYLQGHLRSIRRCYMTL